MAFTKTSDAVLINNYIDGDENALGILIERHQSRIFGFIYSKVNDKDLANDFFQETFIKVIKTLKTNTYYDEKGKFVSWVIRIANNLIVDYYRKNNKSKIVNRDEFVFTSHSEVDYVTDIENLMMTERTYDSIENILCHLPEEQREVLIMRFYKDMSFKEIAEATNVNLNTSLGRMRYAINNLKKLAQKHQISYDLKY